MHFASAINELLKNKPLSQRSRLNLKPFFKNLGILCVGGRLI